MKPKLSRRELLSHLAKLGLVIGGVSIALPGFGCSSETKSTGAGSPLARPTEALPFPAINQASPVSTTTPPAAGTAAAVAASTPTVEAGGRADLAVVKGGDYQAITRAAVGAIGGIERFVPRGSKVVVKPNIGPNRAPQYAATTHPKVVAAMVTLCQEAGASKVTVLDYGLNGPNVGYDTSGIEAAVKRAAGTMERITMMKFKQVAVPEGKEMKSLYIYQDVLDADVVITVPIAKHHSLSGLTLAMKNMMGVTRDRDPFHNNIGQRVADLCTLIRPRLTIVDATRILLRNGPSGGNLADVKQLDTVIASADIVAADAYAATLFGLKGQDIATVRAGQAMGLGTMDLSTLRIATVTI